MIENQSKTNEDQHKVVSGWSLNILIRSSQLCHGLDILKLKLN